MGKIYTVVSINFEESSIDELKCHSFKSSYDAIVFIKNRILHLVDIYSSNSCFCIYYPGVSKQKFDLNFFIDYYKQTLCHNDIDKFYLIINVAEGYSYSFKILENSVC